MAARRPGPFVGCPASIPKAPAVLAEAIDALAGIRTPDWLGDSGVRLHALTSLPAHAEQLLPDAAARDKGLTRTGDRTAARRQRRNSGIPLAMNDDQLDQDHRHNADVTVPTRLSRQAPRTTFAGTPRS